MSARDLLTAYARRIADLEKEVAKLRLAVADGDRKRTTAVAAERALRTEIEKRMARLSRAQREGDGTIAAITVHLSAEERKNARQGLPVIRYVAVVGGYFLVADSEAEAKRELRDAIKPRAWNPAEMRAPDSLPEDMV